MEAVTSEAPRRAADEDLPKVIERSSARFETEETLEAARRLVMLRWRAGAWAVRNKGERTGVDLSNTSGADVPDEIYASALTPDIVRQALAWNGSLVVRGLVPAAIAPDFVHRIDSAVDGFQNACETHTGVSADQGYIPFRPPLPDRKHINDNRKYLAVEQISAMMVDSPILFERLARHLNKSGIIQIAEEVFGERPVTAIQKSTMRRMPAKQGSGWHQDLGAVKEGTKAIALWIAFSPCGRDSPGYEYVRRRFNEAVPQINESLMPWTVTPATVAELRGDASVQTPEFAPGDAVLFDQYSLHRGACYPHMVKDRWSIDTWLFGPSTLPDHLTPLYL